jgi:hypothetical protein
LLPHLLKNLFERRISPGGFKVKEPEMPYCVQRQGDFLSGEPFVIINHDPFPKAKVIVPVCRNRIECGIPGGGEGEVCACREEIAGHSG